ncbi:MAG: DNA repair protein RadA [Rickettsiales bacterium]
MAKPQKQYVCQSCGSVHHRWEGRCDACGEWNTIVEETVAAAPPKSLGKGKGAHLILRPLAETVAAPQRLSTGIEELNRVLGGGLVEGSAILIGGDPGIGKSTLLLQMAAIMAAKGSSAMYISGEESVEQIQLRAMRLGVQQSPLGLASATSVRDILTTLESGDAPDILIIDSVQTLYLDTIESAPGTVAQVRASAHELIRYAKKHGTALFLVGHVTKDGQIAGPRVLEHMVDAVLYFEGERSHLYRILRNVKNRFGATDEIGVFAMGEKGLEEVSNPSSLFLSERHQAVSGTAVFAGMEGTRPVLLEIQALVAPSFLAQPRRAVVGWDSARLSMTLAVLETRGNIRLSDKEVYLSVAGGFRVNEPAADLAAAAAILSAAANVPLPSNAVFFGEIGLSGEIRNASRREARLKESEKLGFSHAYIPESKTKTSAKPKELTLGITPVSHVEQLVKLVKKHG